MLVKGTSAIRLLSVASLIGCMSLIATGCGGQQAEDRPAEPATNWSAPLTDGVSVPTIIAAQRLVSFRVISPSFGGTPSLIQVDDPNQMQVNQRSVAMVFRLPDYGTVDVRESSAAGWTIEREKQRANEPVLQPGASPAKAYPFKMVAVKTTSGLLSASGERATLQWIDGNTLFYIFGPNLTASQVEALAERF
jgi:hypothetical protein